MLLVIPAKAGIQTRAPKSWIPACAGMTQWGSTPSSASLTPFSTAPLSLLNVSPLSAIVCSTLFFLGLPYNYPKAEYEVEAT